MRTSGRRKKRIKWKTPTSLALVKSMKRVTNQSLLLRQMRF